MIFLLPGDHPERLNKGIPVFACLIHHSELYSANNESLPVQNNESIEAQNEIIYDSRC